MSKVVDLFPEPGAEEDGREHEQLWEIVYRVCQRHDVPCKVEGALPLDPIPGKEPL